MSASIPTTHPSLPTHHRALVLESPNIPPTVQTVPTPRPVHGSAVVRILSSAVLSYSAEVFIGNTRNYNYPVPLTPGPYAIARVAAVGPDATKLKPGDLVAVEGYIHGRDDDTVGFVSGLGGASTAAGFNLMRDVWREGSWAEYQPVPLENCYSLNEATLMGRFGYGPEDLNAIGVCAVPYAGLKGVELSAGETVVVAPATGPFGHAAVMVALAMGARVVAMGRNVEVLNAMKERHGKGGRLEVVPLTGRGEEDTEAIKKCFGGPVDVYYDISPPQAEKSTHLRSCIMALKRGGRVSLMGGILSDVAIPHRFILISDITLKGKWMHTRKDLQALIQMIEGGVLGIGKKDGFTLKGKFELEQWKEAFEAAKNTVGLEKVVFNP